MARKVFFSFHYKKDVWRANQVRNSWVTQGKTAAGFIDAAEFEEIQESGDEAVEEWIDEQLKGTSVTVVLIGSNTSNRKYVKYEIKKSYERGNGLLGVYIHKLKNENGKKSTKGSKAFGKIGKDEDGDSIYFYQVADTHDYVDDDGYKNLGEWIEDSLE